MSGEYKYSNYVVDPSYTAHLIDPNLVTIDPTIAVVVLGSIVAQRAAEAVLEETRRLDRQEQVLNAGLKAAQGVFQPQIDKLTLLVGTSRDKMLPHDAVRLNERVTTLQTAVAAARTHKALRDLQGEIAHIQKDVFHAIEHKIVADSRSRGGGSQELRERFEALRERFAGTSSPDDPDGPRDPEGERAVRRAIAAAAASLQAHDSARQERAIAQLATILESYEAALTQADQQKALRDELTLQLSSLVEGLESDDVVMRWQSEAVEQISRASDALNAKAALTDQDVSSVIETVSKAAEEAVHLANLAQIKADQRDYVAAGIGNVLQEMGYIAQPPVPEYSGHPASALIVTASSPSGRAIAVSIPMEGQVWYNVEGFVKSTEAAVGGGTAAVCDEAEAVIEQMHEALAAEYHINMGEILWEGKDPNRALRQAKSFSDETDRGTGR